MAEVEILKVKIKRIDKDLPLPTYQTKGSAGVDFFAKVKTVIKAKSWEKIPAEASMETSPPPDCKLLVSSYGLIPFRKDLSCSNQINEYQIPVFNFTDQEAVIEPGEKIAIGIFIPIEKD